MRARFVVVTCVLLASCKKEEQGPVGLATPIPHATVKPSAPREEPQEELPAAPTPSGAMVPLDPDIVVKEDPSRAALIAELMDAGAEDLDVGEAGPPAPNQPGACGTPECFAGPRKCRDLEERCQTGCAIPASACLSKCEAACIRCRPLCQKSSRSAGCVACAARCSRCQSSCPSTVEKCRGECRSRAAACAADAGAKTH